jgi:hypothetical protein
MPLAEHLAEFDGAAVRLLDLIARVHQADAAGRYLWSLEHRAFVTQAAFLGIYIEWENFLEHAFLSYLTGEPAIGGKIIPRYAEPVDEEHAGRILKGTARYCDFTDATTITTLADNYFRDGGAISPVIRAIAQDLSDLKTIRNASAHVVTGTRSKLQGLGARKLKGPVGQMSVYEFLLRKDPSSATGESILADYVGVLRAAGEAIARATTA